MCNLCTAHREPIELTEATYPQMLDEATEAATTAAEHLGRGWFTAATGLLRDINHRWQHPGMCRMAWTWAAMCYFLPESEEWNQDLDFTTTRERLIQSTGNEPSDAEVSQMIHTQDQLRAVITELKEHVSTRNLAAYMKLFQYTVDSGRLQPLTALLLGEAAARTNQAAKDGDETSMNLLCAHITEDLDGTGDTTTHAA